MDSELVVDQLSCMSKDLVKIKNTISKKHEKFVVALTGVFRLISGDGNSTLVNIQGSPESLKGYIVNLALELRQNTENCLEKINSQLMTILSEVQ